MEPLIINEKEDTPSVILDSLNNKFEIKGRSMPENVNEFYTTIIDWMKEYSRHPNDETILDFRLEYYNSASAKHIFELVYGLGKLKDAGKEVLVRWFYQTDDEDMADSGQTLATICKVPFKLIPIY